MTAPLAITGHRTADAIDESELRIYDGGSHGIMLSHSARVNADIDEFVKAHS